MNNYELTLILRIGETLDPLKAAVKDLFTKHSLSVQGEDEWGTRKLAYQIDGESDGYYCHFRIQAPPLSIQKITNEFRLNNDILRFLFVRLDERASA